jgi:hypothetical protein
MKKDKVFNKDLANVKGRKVVFNFNGGDVTSDAGGLLLSQVDLKLGLTKSFANSIEDTRVKGQIEHSQHQMLKQRVYGIGFGYEDVNDQDSLRIEPGFQTIVGETKELASGPTICRFENRANKGWAWEAHRCFFNAFVSSFETPPDELILDFDATDDRIHGNQQGRYFHGYYDSYCFLPLYVFCGSQLLTAYLRPSCIDAAKHSLEILVLLVRSIRKVWPQVKIIFRGDGGFCRHRLMKWMNRNKVDFITGLAKNSILLGKTAELREAAKDGFEKSREKKRLFDDFKYAAKTWEAEQRIICKAEHTMLGENTRFIVTSLEGSPQDLYDKIYCHRGEMENKIKEQQLCLFADRTSCTNWDANQFRLVLSSLAYILIDTLRRTALSGTPLAKAQCSTIRLKLFKIGAVILRNTRRIQFLMSSGYPYKAIFKDAIEYFVT